MNDRMILNDSAKGLFIENKGIFVRAVYRSVNRLFRAGHLSRVAMAQEGKEGYLYSLTESGSEIRTNLNKIGCNQISYYPQKLEKYEKRESKA